MSDVERLLAMIRPQDYADIHGPECERDAHGCRCACHLVSAYEAAVEALAAVVAAWDQGKQRHDMVLGPAISDARLILRRLREKVTP